MFWDGVEPQGRKASSGSLLRTMTWIMDGISSQQSSALSRSSASIGSKINVAVLGKVQDQQKAEGEAAVRLIESARLAKEPGKGGRLDVRG